MYKGTSKSEQYMGRTGSSALTPRLSASVNLKPENPFEIGRLAELKDEQNRLKAMKHTAEVQKRLAIIGPEIKRLNRIASEEPEKALMWKAIHSIFNEDQIRLLNQKIIELRLNYEG